MFWDLTKYVLFSIKLNLLFKGVDRYFFFQTSKLFFFNEIDI